MPGTPKVAACCAGRSIAMARGVVITASVRERDRTRKVRKRIALHTTLIRGGRRISYR